MIDKTNDINNNLNNLDFTRLRSQFKSIFKRPPFSRKFQQHKKITGLNRSNEIDNNQDILYNAFLNNTRDFF